MIFETHTLNSPLQQYVESIFHFKDFMPQHSIERVVPTGHLFLIFELDGMVRNTFHNETLEPKNTFTKVWVSGIHKNYISISAHEKSEMFVIQFKPFGAYPFLQLPMDRLTERILPAEEILGEAVLKLRTQILNGESSSDKFSVAEKWLTEKYASKLSPSQDLIKVVESLQSESVTNCLQILETYPNTQKHLIDQFKKYIGLTPKYYQRIWRFNDILQKIKQKESISWAQIAYDCGYADQSHFIKEFKHFSGFNPKEFILQEFHQDEPNFFPLDRRG